MVKIIFSGTYDGFSPRYASDGILDDSVTRSLVDRRKFLSRDSNRLYKEGYSFQLLAGQGILYHKIILVFDGFGRDGFAMVSLFLPLNELLEGSEIKDTLDSVMSSYKARLQNGIANMELDWTFVKKAADEINAKVRSVRWRKLPYVTGTQASSPAIPPNTQKTALIRGVENRVVDFFNYPNPLHSRCSDFEQVFLTESIFDPAMAAEYAVLTADEVDIDNPEYAIEFENQQIGASLSPGIRKTITKKELDAPTNIYLGTYSKPGFRSANVEIKQDEKVSRDGFSISVKLPDLSQKKATVELDVRNGKTGQKIPILNCSVLWSRSAFDKPEQLNPVDGKFHFLGEQCDARWNFTVRCDAYEVYSGEVTVNDAKESQQTVRLSPRLYWKVCVKLSDGKVISVNNSADEDMLEDQIDAAKRYIERNGLSVGKTDRDKASATITVYGEKKAVILDGSNMHGGTPSGDEMEIGQTEEKSFTHFMQFDDKSKGFALFKDQKKKRRLEEKLDQKIKEIERQKSSLKKPNYYDSILEHLRDRRYSEAKSAFNNHPDSEQYRDINETVKEAVDLLKKYHKIPAVFKESQGLTYSIKEHRAVFQSEKKKDSRSVTLKKSRWFRYKLVDPEWNVDTKGPSSYLTTEVKRSLLGSAWIVIVLSTIVLVSAILVLLFGKGGGKSEYNDLRKDIDNILSGCHEASLWNDKATRYCGDSIMNLLEDWKNNSDTFLKSNPKYKDSTCFKELDSVYNEQKERKKNDETKYNGYSNQIEAVNDPTELDLNKLDSIKIDLEKDSIISKNHFDELIDSRNKKKETLKFQYDDNQDKKNQQKQQEEQRLYDKALTGSIDDCHTYVWKYRTGGGLNEYTTQAKITTISARKAELAKQLADKARDTRLRKQERINAANKYLQYYPNGNAAGEMRDTKNALSNASNGSTGKSQQNQPAANANSTTTKQPAAKTKVTSLSSLFNFLTWDNVKDNGKKFKEQYDYSNFKTRVDTIISKANSVGKNGYENARKSANGDLPDGVDKLTALEHYLGLHGPACTPLH